MATDVSKSLATNNLIAYAKTYSSSNDLPADTVDWGTAWSGYTDLGGTEGGLRFAFNAQRAALKWDQSPTAIKRPFTDETVEMGTVMGEITPDNLLFATGQGAVTTVAAGSGTRGHKELVISGNPVDTYRSFGFDVLMDDGEAFRVFGGYAVATGSPALEMTAERLSGIQLTASLFPDPNNDDEIAKVRDVIAALP